MKKGFKQLLAEAYAVIETVPATEAMKQLHSAGVAFIDIRDLPALERDGIIPGAIHASRGMLEFFADPESPYHKEVFLSGKKLFLYCASGGPSALAAQCLQEMGLNHVAHISGGLKAWKEADGPIEIIRR
jgi:rhodanese-related sulfurtransferase